MNAAIAAPRHLPRLALRIGGRLLESLVTLWLLVTLCFFLLRAAPGGPFDTEKAAPPEVIAVLSAEYRLDQPLVQQYFGYVGDLLQGDLGPSFQYVDYQVGELILLALPVTLVTGGLALLLALGGGIAIGIVAARQHSRWPDRALMLLSGLGLAIPKYVAAPLLILLFAITLRWLPAGGMGSPAHLLLPVLALALPNLAYCAQLMRASLLEIEQADYLRAARARGYGELRVLLMHSLRPALLPLVAWLSPAMINLVTGSAVVEQIFGLPGLGRYFVQGALNRDYTLVLGVVITVGASIVLINLLVDSLRAAMDPRLRDPGR